MSNDHYTYGKDRAELETVMRLSAVKRWHMIDTTRTQNLAEHSANVALLAYTVAMRAPRGFFGPAVFMMTAGMLHDLAEVFTGDIPSHTKRHLTGVEQLEKSTLPFMFGTDYGANEKILIKLCDLADGVRFIRLHGVDITAKHAMIGLEEQMYRWFSEAEKLWPEEVFDIAKDMIIFYAYEQSHYGSQQA